MDITSTEISALFGCSPYTTEFELWHRKKSGDIEAIEENERMKWGSRLQAAIAHGVAEDRGWKIREVKEYIRRPESRVGSSFDFAVLGDSTQPPDSALLEIKNVDSLAFKEGWLVNDDGSVEAPLHIELQVQHQMLVSGIGVAHIGALVGGNKVVLIERVASGKTQAAILQKAAAFWKSIDASTPPAPNFEKDAAFIAELYSFAQPGRVAMVQENDRIDQLAHEYFDAGTQERLAKGRKDAAKAEILTLINDAEKAIGNGFSISAGMVGPTRIEYDREGYRGFRITWKKEKK